MKNVLHLIRDYFGFSRIESRGLLFLLGLITISVLLNIYYQHSSLRGYNLLSQDQRELNALISQLDENLLEEELTKTKIKDEVKEVKRFPFDPNSATVSRLVELGIPEFLSRRIDKYRSKGGKFYQAEDLLKIYGFERPLYQKLEAYVRIKNTKPYTSAKKTFKQETESIKTSEIPNAEPAKVAIRKININRTDSLALQMLSGIGPVTSSRIIRFRDKMGGLHSLEQLKEVYHISEEALQSLQEYAFVEESFETQKININQVDFKTLLSHPYVDYEVAKAIINHRRIYGNFTSTDQLKEVYQIKEELLVKLLPYLVI